MMQATIFKEESLATLDGDGIRYALFFSGCPMRCVYCHNPDSWNLDGYQIDLDTIVKKIIRYKPYFKNNGGVTLSGGEPLVQTDFILALCQKLKENHIKIALDTSASLYDDKIEQIYDLVDTPIIDIKFYSDELYKKHTSFSISKLLETLDYLLKIDKKITIRTVIVPNINDNEESILKYIAFLKPYDTIIKAYTLLPFHTLGFSKYEDLKIFNPLSKTPSMDSSKFDKFELFLYENLNK